MCAGGEDSLSSTPADTQSPRHGRGPVGADSETDNSHTEKRNSATGGDTGTNVLSSPSLPSSFFFFNVHILTTSASSSSQGRHTRKEGHSPDRPAKRPRLDHG